MQNEGNAGLFFFFFHSQIGPLSSGVVVVVGGVGWGGGILMIGHAGRCSSVNQGHLTQQLKFTHGRFYREDQLKESFERVRDPR